MGENIECPQINGVPVGKAVNLEDVSSSVNGGEKDVSGSNVDAEASCFSDIDDDDEELHVNVDELPVDAEGTKPTVKVKDKKPTANDLDDQGIDTDDDDEEWFVDVEGTEQAVEVTEESTTNNLDGAIREIDPSLQSLIGSFHEIG